jgi:hypothetical protein
MKAVCFCVAAMLAANSAVRAEESLYGQFTLTGLPKSTSVPSLYTGLPATSVPTTAARTTPLTGLYAAKVTDFVAPPATKQSATGLASPWVSPLESIQQSTGILQTTTVASSKPSSLTSVLSPTDSDWRQQMRQPTIDWSRTNAMLRNQPAIGGVR